MAAPRKRAATAIFIGRMRSQGSSAEELEAMQLEHYPGMTERQLQHWRAMQHPARRARRAASPSHWPGDTNQALVLVAVSADRRGPAQRCCQALLEAIKHDAPFWKQEISRSGKRRWIEGNTPL